MFRTGIQVVGRKFSPTICPQFSYARLQSGTGSSVSRLLSIMSAASKCVIENCMRAKLQQRFNPIVLRLVNESRAHNVPEGSETHFKVVVVSDEFNGMSLIKRHRLVNETLADELRSGVHALSIVAKAPEQWQQDEPIESSPNCRGGFGK